MAAWSIGAAGALPTRNVLSYLNSSGAWRGLQSVAKVTGERRIGEQVSIESRYYISSLPGGC